MKKNEDKGLLILRLITYIIIFMSLTLPIFNYINKTEYYTKETYLAWLFTSIILGLFMGILNEIYSMLKELTNKK